ncbi:SLC13 family permease [Cupriavidus basilensis]
MSELQIYIVLGVFGAVILAIAFNLMDMAVAALIGVCVLIALGILNEQDLLSATRTSGGPISLLFGGMVVARILSTTGIFDRIGDLYLSATGGSGRTVPAATDRAGRAPVPPSCRTRPRSS